MRIGLNKSESSASRAVGQRVSGSLCLIGSFIRHIVGIETMRLTLQGAAPPFPPLFQLLSIVPAAFRRCRLITLVLKRSAGSRAIR